MKNAHGRNLAQARIESLRQSSKSNLFGAFATAQNIANNPSNFQPNRAMRRHAAKTKGNK